ncbi:tetratricopeptide repeat protein [Hahella sp. KA22]|uniref:tetratricopeptide repeat protein n=1 Tax=Hahella sp. KA22 TaxID=1628392 RepID=UPI000FDDB8DC|nr:tetratricopeptide repeat protein [Hahella sp. KA22]AZZ94645.1 tetratricopeptide repeat protein [Hahella sp. KA22]QAY58018.1 tetratricopeptide repeat protein [Hahella sp. KA22]
MMRLLNRVCVLGILAVMTGCGVNPYRSATTETGPETTQPSTPATETAAPQQPDRTGRPVSPPVRISRVEPTPAARQMLANAETAAREGRYDQAMLMVERAQRMSPKAGDVYLVMARLHYEQQRYAKSEQLCLKALSLAGDDKAFKESAMYSLDKARQAQGK